MSDLTKFEPLPNVGNVVSNNVTAFNQGYNLYQCINYLQGYVAIVYENMDALLDDWNNFQQVINENISNIATEETKKVLNQWLEDGTLNDLIAKNPLWNQKLDKSGGTMTGNVKFSENTKIVGTTPGGNDIDLIHNTNDGASGNYVQFGDPVAKTVINSSQQPVWHNGGDDYLLLTQKQLDDGLAGKVNKSGDTMTGNLDLKQSLFLHGKIAWNQGYNIIQREDDNMYFGDKNYVFFIASKNDRIYMRKSNNTNVGILVTDDIINNLTSLSTTQLLSAAQGKVLNDKINNIKFTELIASSENSWKDFSVNINDYDAYLLICAQTNFAGLLGSIIVPKHSITLNNEISAFYPAETSSYEVKMKFTTNSNMQVWTKSQYDGCVVYGLKLGGESS